LLLLMLLLLLLLLLNNRYLNTLTFGGVMMSYLLYRGMNISTVGTWRGISSLIGLLGTFAYQISIKRMNIISTGMWSILYQLVCISCSMASMFIEDFTLSMTLMMIGVCTSRIGLYVFDISVTQLMQMNIPDGIRGMIGGIQESLNAFFQLSSFALCLIYSNPNDFIIPVAVGYSAVACAALFYSVGIYYHSSNFISKPHTK
jgi:solute carrier family 40 (iron-regulated transporter), member 1